MIILGNSERGYSITPGLEIDVNCFEQDCPECGRTAKGKVFEVVEGGTLNSHETVSCKHCGYFETDYNPY